MFKRVHMCHVSSEGSARPSHCQTLCQFNKGGEICFFVLKKLGSNFNLSLKLDCLLDWFIKWYVVQSVLWLVGSKQESEMFIRYMDSKPWLIYWLVGYFHSNIWKQPFMVKYSYKYSYSPGIKHGCASRNMRNKCAENNHFVLLPAESLTFTLGRG